MTYYDHLRLPWPNDPSADAYKDWLHVNIFDHLTGMIGLVNVSLQGNPINTRSRAAGAGLVNIPHSGWIGDLQVRGIGETDISDVSIGMEVVGLALHNESGAVYGSVRDTDNALYMSFVATKSTPPIIVEEEVSLSSGWISWYAVPRLTLAGRWRIGKRSRVLREASAYHDHNWGRWRWGEDFGWEWGCFLAAGGGPAIVFSRMTDSDHRSFKTVSLTIDVGSKRRTFSGPTITVSQDRTTDNISLRIPGALAVLHEDRAHLQLPKNLRIVADDGFDRLVVEFKGRDSLQMIAADPFVRGYSFIHELPGSFSYRGKLGGKNLSGEGLGVFEYVC